MQQSLFIKLKHNPRRNLCSNQQLVFIFMFGIGTTAFAQDESDQPSESTLSVISANVAGLPIPSFFDDEGKVVPKTQKIMGQLLNESGVDIVCVQEDFQ